MAIVKQETGVERHFAGAVNKDDTRGYIVASLILGGLAFVVMMVAVWAVFLYAPTDAIEGDAQRIFYFHMPTAMLALLSFAVVTLGGVMYLWKGDERWDWLARAAAELGAIFITLTLITGSIWGRTTWGAWWTWDARLTTTLILWFINIGYILMRGYMGRTQASARAGAVLAIIGLVDVPIIYESVNWWRTLHPQAVLPLGSSPQLPPSMLLTLGIASLAITLLFSFLMVQLYQLQKMQALAQELRAGVE